jgi:hypothetical protein
LDTVRLLAEETGDLVDEVWNYIKGGKLVEAAVLLLAAQGQIRGGRSSKRNGNGKQNGFEVLEHYVNAATQLDERTTFKHVPLPRPRDAHRSASSLHGRRRLLRHQPAGGRPCSGARPRGGGRRRGGRRGLLVCGQGEDTERATGAELGVVPGMDG